MGERKGAGSWNFDAVVGVVVLLGTPWLGLSGSGYTARNLGFCAANTVIAPFIALSIVASQQLVVALTARVLRDRVVAVVLGMGPQVYAFQLGSCHVSIRAVPIAGGNAIVTTKARGQRLRAAISSAVGVAYLAGALAIVQATMAPSWSDIKATMVARLAPDAIAIYVALLAALIGAVTLHRIAQNDPKKLRAQRALGFAFEGERSMKVGAYDVAIDTLRRGLADSPNDFLLELTLAGALGCRDDDEAFGFTEALIKRTDIPAALMPYALNVWAWQCYLSGDAKRKLEADEASQRALTACPDQPSILDTRGHVLFWNGRHVEAEEHLRRAYRLAPNRSTRASSAAGLAILCASSATRRDEALEWLARDARRAFITAQWRVLWRWLSR